MTLINAISALGNNNSIYPLLVRDCGIENVAKVTMTYRQNKKESKFIAKQATRERIIDEYGTSAVWLGGIPLLGLACDKFIQKTGFSPKIDTKLLKETSSQGLYKNINKFKNLAPEAIADLEKVAKNKKMFIGLQIGKLLTTTLIPIALMGFILPKLNYKYTQRKLNEAQNNSNLCSKYISIDKFENTISKKSPSFKGIENFLNMSDLQKMTILDAGLTVGRVNTSRNKNEKAEMLFKMRGMCYLNYIAPKNIEKLLNKITKSLFGLNTVLDPKIINNKEFLNAIKNKKLILPDTVSENEIIDFLDNNSSSMFCKLAEKMKLVSYLDTGIRDPRKYTDTKKIIELKNAIEVFANDSLKSGSVDKYAKKALKAKSFNILANVAISSFLLAMILPKLQFLFRKITTGSNLDPGIKFSDKTSQ